MKRFVDWFFSWFEAIPGEDGGGDYEVDDPHDPQVITRLQFDDDFRIFERNDK